MLLSPHFTQAEFEVDGCLILTDDIREAYRHLCVEVLEPIREWAGEPAHITSGYRDRVANRRVVGDDSDSQHIATADRAAADFYFDSYHHSMQPVADWVRMESGINFDQMILEHGKRGDTIHISWSRTPRRVALEGQTFHQSGYESRYVAPIRQSNV